MTSRETGSLPAPLTPTTCDLRDFAFMPLDVVRLRDSDLAVTAEADEFRCAVLLWCASWHQVPAGSLPDDDKALAQYAGYGRVVKEWLKVRAGALRGWVKCEDGRLYHPVVAEKANEAWLAKLRQRLKTECARIKKHNDRHEMKLPYPEFDAWMAAGCPVGQPLPVPRDKSGLSLGTGVDVPEDNDRLSPEDAGDVPSENDSKGQGEGQGHLIITPIPPDGGSVPARTKASRIALQTFLDDCKAKGERPLRDYAPLWGYVKDARLPVEFVALAWAEFIRRFGTGGVKDKNRQANWRQTFRNYIERNFLKLWAIDANGEYFLTTLGKQAQMTYESKEAA